MDKRVKEEIIMTIWQLRQIIESHTPWWVPAVVLMFGIAIVGFMVGCSTKKPIHHNPSAIKECFKENVKDCDQFKK